MKNGFKFIFALMFLMAIFPLVSGEMVLWENVIIDNSANSVSHHAYYQYYDDIEELSRGGQLIVDLKRSLYAGRTNDVLVWANIEPMPYVTANYTINYCELNATHLMTDYDNSGNLISTNETTYGYIYSGTPANTTFLFFKMKNRDSLIIDARCYYNDSNYLYQDSILFARSGIYLPANKCNDCTQYTLEELSNEIDRQDQMIQQETSIYVIIQKVIDFNFKMWLIVLWLVKLLLVLIAIFFVFYGIYYLYKFLKDIHDKI